MQSITLAKLSLKIQNKFLKNFTYSKGFHIQPFHWSSLIHYGQWETFWNQDFPEYACFSKSNLIEHSNIKNRLLLRHNVPVTYMSVSRITPFLQVVWLAHMCFPHLLMWWHVPPVLTSVVQLGPNNIRLTTYGCPHYENSHSIKVGNPMSSWVSSFRKTESFKLDTPKISNFLETFRLTS